MFFRACSTSVPPRWPDPGDTGMSATKSSSDTRSLAPSGVAVPRVTARGVRIAGLDMAHPAGPCEGIDAGELRRAIPGGRTLLPPCLQSIRHSRSPLHLGWPRRRHVCVSSAVRTSVPCCSLLSASASITSWTSLRGGRDCLSVLVPGGTNARYTMRLHFEMSAPLLCHHQSCIQYSVIQTAATPASQVSSVSSTPSRAVLH